MSDFLSLLSAVKHCRICAGHLPHEPKPVLQLHPNAKILIAGQAPGRKVHASGIPFDDASGQRLRRWLGMSKDVFYNPKKVAILPMGFCYPGAGKSGDLAPRTECAPAWRAQLLQQLKHIKLTLVLGQYAQKYHYDNANQSLTDAVKAWKTSWPNKVVLPHPSPRNNIWLKRNLWFEEVLIPKLQQRVAELL